MNLRNLFLQHVAQTSPEPIALNISKAEGIYLIDDHGKKYIDLIGGIAVCHLGHGYPRLINAIKAQADKYLHVMVYGELIQSPQVNYATMLSNYLPQQLNTVYFTNSGAEAVEGAIKLAKRITGRPQLVAAHNSYHGSTTGALSLMGDEYWRNSFRPLMPGVIHETYGSDAFLKAISTQTAAVIIEPVQAEAGVKKPTAQWMQRLRQRCTATGTLLIFDEIQTGFGRTGSLWAFEQYDVVPDVLLLGKALGGGMPLGAFISSHAHMQSLISHPVLGHITTFGGHPVCCAAGLEAFKILIEEQWHLRTEALGASFEQKLVHPKIKAVYRAGLLIAVELDSFDTVTQVLKLCLAQGVFSDWFLFASNCIRIVPPYTISEKAISESCSIILEALEAIG